jgi:ankyrin repeat protein
VQSADRDNMTCMHNAVLRGSLPVVDILLEAGLDIDITVTRLHRRLLRALEDHDSAASSNFHSKFGLTPLHAAASFGRPGVLQYLLDRGADVSADNEHAQIALHLVLGRSLTGSRMEDMWEDDIDVIDHVWEFDVEEDADRTCTVAQTIEPK